MPLKTYADPRRLIDTTGFYLNGETLTATRYGTPNRVKGRRIVVRDAKGIVRFDTDDHYDNANAVNAFDLWRATRSRPVVPDTGESTEELIEKIMLVVDEVSGAPETTAVEWPGAKPLVMASVAQATKLPNLEECPF